MENEKLVQNLGNNETLAQKNKALSDDELDTVPGGEGEPTSLYGQSGCPGPSNVSRERCSNCSNYIELIAEPDCIPACLGV